MTPHRIAVIPGDGIGPEVIPEALACLETVAARAGRRPRDGDVRLGLGALPRRGRDDARRRSRAARGVRRDPPRPGGRPADPGHGHRLGAHPLPAPDLRPVREPAARAAAARRAQPARRRHARGRRHRLRAREHRGRVRRRGRARPRRALDRARRRDVRVHPRRDRADRPLRVRARDRARAPARHERDEVQRAAARDAAVGRRVRRGRRGASRRSRRTAASSTRSWRASCAIPPRSTWSSASNLFGDILTDLGAAIAGSLGIAPSANLDPTRRNPSLFQAIHGSAPDIAGRGIANPVAEIWSAAMLLDFLGEADAGAALLSAVETTIADPATRTPDLGGTRDDRRDGRRGRAPRSASGLRRRRGAAPPTRAGSGRSRPR